MNPISLNGKLWKIHRETETRIVLVPAANPLAAWRKKKKLTTRQASEVLGISCGQITRIEKGTRSFPPDLMSKIA